jgi:hypothetical protein
MENLWTHFVPTASAICGVKTEHSELKRYRNPRRICHIILIFFCIGMFPLNAVRRFISVFSRPRYWNITRVNQIESTLTSSNPSVTFCSQIVLITLLEEEETWTIQGRDALISFLGLEQASGLSHKDDNDVLNPMPNFQIGRPGCPPLLLL